MLKIDQKQVAALEASTQQKFEDRLLETAIEGFPLVYLKLGEGAIRELAEEALRRAPEYGLESEQGVALFFWLMLEHGAKFDSECSWARNIFAHSVDEELLLDMLGDASDEALAAGQDIGHPMYQQENPGSL